MDASASSQAQINLQSQINNGGEKEEEKKRDQNFVGEIKLHTIYSQRKNAHNVQNILLLHTDHRKAWKVFANELDKSKTICVAKLDNGK